MMLVHIGQPEVAGAVHNAWMKTIEEGIHTYDIFKKGVSTQKVGTKEFGDAIIANMGKEPDKFHPANYHNHPKQTSHHAPDKGAQVSVNKQIVGVDVFLDSREDVETISAAAQKVAGEAMELTLITSRGARVWPDTMPETTFVDQWRCRYVAKNHDGPITHDQVLALLKNLSDAGLDYTKMEQLYSFDGEHRYSLANAKRSEGKPVPA